MKKPTIAPIEQITISQEMASFVLANNKKFLQNLPTDKVIVLIQKGLNDESIFLSDDEKETLKLILK